MGKKVLFALESDESKVQLPYWEDHVERDGSETARRGREQPRDFAKTAEFSPPASPTKAPVM